jgi:hypothetical protein
MRQHAGRVPNLTAAGLTQPVPVARPSIKSRQRVADHGEVFTPDWLVEDMLNLVKDESERIDARFLEPACGSGNFLIPVLKRKLATVEARYRRSDFEKRHHALLALMSIYGIELLADNAAECRMNLLDAFSGYLRVGSDSQWYRAAQTVLELNIVRGDALSMTDAGGAPITFPEWAYLGRGRFQRRDFRYQDLAQRSSFEGTLWERPEAHEAFIPAKHFAPMTLRDLGH